MKGRWGMAKEEWPKTEWPGVTEEGSQGEETRVATGLPRCGGLLLELQPSGLGLPCSRAGPPVKPGSPGGPSPGAPALSPQAAGGPMSSGPGALPHPPTSGLGSPCRPAVPSGSGTLQGVGSSRWGTCPWLHAPWASWTI